MARTLADALSLLPERLRKRRLDLRLSIKEVYVGAHISRPYYYQLENKAGVRPAADVLERLAQVLDTTTGYLMGLTEAAVRRPRDEIPPELRTVATRHRLAAEDIAVLKGINWKGRRPRTVDDWDFLVQAIERAVR